MTVIELSPKINLWRNKLAKTCGEILRYSYSRMKFADKTIIELSAYFILIPSFVFMAELTHNLLFSCLLTYYQRFVKYLTKLKYIYTNYPIDLIDFRYSIFSNVSMSAAIFLI